MVKSKSYYTLDQKIAEVEGVTKSLALTALNKFGNDVGIVQSASIYFAVPDHRQDIIGGGVWPAPFSWNPLNERNSFFWSRTLSGHLKFYDQYKDLTKKGYEHAHWNVPTWYMKNGQIFWSRSYTDLISLEHIITCATPLYLGDINVGTVSIDFNLKVIDEMVNTFMANFPGYAYILDRSSRFISYPKMEMIKTRKFEKINNESFFDYLSLDKFTENFPLFLSHTKILKK